MPRIQPGPSANKFIRPQGGKIFKGLWDQSRQWNKDCRFRNFTLTNSHFEPSNICLLEDKIQNWGMYLFTISYGSNAMDQRSEMVESVDDLKSSRSVKDTPGPDFELLDARVASVLNKIIQNTRLKKKVSLEEMKAHKEDRFLRRKRDRLPDLRILPGHWCQWFCRELCRPIYSCSSKWWYSGIRFKMGRNSIIDDTTPIWWHHGKLVQIKNTRVWETQDRIGIVQCGDSSEEGWTWLSQIEDNGKKKYRARDSK